MHSKISEFPLEIKSEETENGGETSPSQNGERKTKQKKQIELEL